MPGQLERRVGISFIPVVDSRSVAANCPQLCRSATARSSSGEHRSIVQILKPAAIQPRASSSIRQGELADDPQVDQPAAEYALTLRGSAIADRNAEHWCRTGMLPLLAGTEMASVLTLGRLEQLSTIGAAHGITGGAPLAPASCRGGGVSRCRRQFY